MKKEELYMILQFTGGTFPTGSFSQSWGLETYVFQELVTDEDSFRKFLDVFICTTLAGLEGPVLCGAYDLAKEGKLEEMIRLDRQLTAMKLTKESRENCLRMGNALMRIVVQMTEDDFLASYYESSRQNGCSYPVAFAAVSARLGIEKEEALNAFLFSSVNALVQSGLKLIPLGNIQAQRILMDYYGAIGEAALQAMQTDPEEAFSFCPGLDLASMIHEALPSRLYMS